ncbi:MAG: PolC-type DNA polymerase III [Oligoflexales bacterium]
MSLEQLGHSIFHDVFFPRVEKEERPSDSFNLSQVLRYEIAPQALLEDVTMVVFDFETTGLDVNNDRIIEIGALKTYRGKVIEEFSQLIDPGMIVPDIITKLCGITNEMVQGQPQIQEVLPTFLDFLSGSVLVAHNAEFDFNFLKSVANREGYQIVWPCFCTLKMAKLLLPELESKNLDRLAEHFKLKFEARHRSIGDCKVTQGVLMQLLKVPQNPSLAWQDLSDYKVE